jgi:hypothetical protein
MAKHVVHIVTIMSQEVTIKHSLKFLAEPVPSVCQPMLCKNQLSNAISMFYGDSEAPDLRPLLKLW